MPLILRATDAGGMKACLRGRARRDPESGPSNPSQLGWSASMTTDGQNHSHPRPWRSIPGVRESTGILERAQDLVTLLVGVVLIALAITLLVAAAVDFLRDVQHHAVATAGENLLDRILLVLILAEIVHTVVLSLRAHSLVAQPFVVVGLVAVIRRILFILSNAIAVSTAQFALLLSMVIVFIAGLVVVNRFERQVE